METPKGWWQHHNLLDFLINQMVACGIKWGWSRNELTDRLNVAWLNQTGTSQPDRFPSTCKRVGEYETL